MKIRAAVATQANEPLLVTDVELAPPQSGEVLIRMKATGLPLQFPNGARA
jgi:Zn-dependent alcohol dehydrogenase